MKGKTQAAPEARKKESEEAAKAEKRLKEIKILTNQVVIDMVKLALPATVIVTKIKTSETSFNTDITALKILTGAKVPEIVMSAMIEKNEIKPLASEEKSSKAQAPVTAKTSEFKPLPNPDFLSATEKHRHKQSVQIQIGASADKVSALLIRAFQDWNYPSCSVVRTVEGGRRGPIGASLTVVRLRHLATVLELM